MRDAINRVLGKFKGVRKGKGTNQWQVLCPVHGDREQSMGVLLTDSGRICFHCFAGCTYEEHRDAIGETDAALGPDPDHVPPSGPVEPELPDEYRDIWERWCAKWSADFARSTAAQSQLAKALDLPESVFAQFPGLGCCTTHRNGSCWTFPERDATGFIIGVGLRFKDDTKRQAEDSRRGLSIPSGWRERPGALYLVEGPTDVLAMTAAGLAAIGRPSVNGGLHHLAELIKAEVPADRQIIFMGENDRKKGAKLSDEKAWPGLYEARKAARKLIQMSGRDDILFSLPPFDDKDVRRCLTRMVADGTEWPHAGTRLAEEVAKTATAPPEKSDPPPPTSPPDESGRTTVSLQGNHQKATNDTVLELLAKDNNLYARGNILVRTVHAPGRIIYRGKDGNGKPVAAIVIPAQARLSAVQPPTLREKISDVASFTKPARGGARPVDVPDWCVMAIHAREEWPTLKNLTALVDYPVLRPDGTIFATHGHDPVTGVFYNHTGTVTVPENPTRADALAAWGRLKQVVCDFPFEHADIHLAAWLAALLTPMTRFAFHGCVPVFLIDGNVMGAGKGLLADTISLILTGRPFATMGYTEDNTEMSKRITAIAVEGEQLVMFDNINQGFGGSAIDRALTSLEWSERLLGHTRNIKCPLRVGWYGTGNNVELVGDILRRLCQIRLESPDDKPEERRNFRHADLRAWIMVERDQLLSDAATILAAYYADGAPKKDLKAWGSFEAWSNVVRQCIVWLGLEDPMSTRDRIFMDADVSRSAVRSIIYNWRKIDTAGDGLTTNEIIEKVFGSTPSGTCNSFADLDEDESKPTKNPLAEVANAIKQLTPKPTARSLAQHFRKHRATRFGGLYLSTVGDDRNSSLRWIVRVSKTNEKVPLNWKPGTSESKIAGIAGGLSDSERSPSESEPW